MNQKYDHTYSDQMALEFTEAIESAEQIEKYSFEVEDGFRMPPILDCVKLFSVFTSNDESPDAEQLRDKVMHYCILNKNVTLYLDDNKIGTIHVSNLSDSWDSFNELTDHPLGFTLIRNAALWFVVGKFKPSLKKTTGQAAAVKAIKK
jgi:hypothetical protein